jgi:hypothetical protein
MPEARTLHTDSNLTNLSIRYRNEAMIWPAVMPIIKVNKRSDKYNVYNKADSYTLANDAIGPKSLPNEVDWGVSSGNYSVKDHALSDWVPQEEIDNADTPLQPEVDSVEFLNLLLDIAQEKRVCDIFNTSSNFSQKTTLSGTSQWGQSADDPVGNLLTAVEGCFIRANTLVFGADAWVIFRKLPEVLDAVKGTVGSAPRGGLASTTEVAQLLEVERVIVGRGRYNAAKEGQTASYSRLWGKHCWALYVDPNPSVKSITFGGTFVEMNRNVQRDFDQKRGIKGAHFFKTAWNSDEKIIASDVGYMLENVVP